MGCDLESGPTAEINREISVISFTLYLHGEQSVQGDL